jgi:hypothetical protein
MDALPPVLELGGEDNLPGPLIEESESGFL